MNYVGYKRQTEGICKCICRWPSNEGEDNKPYVQKIALYMLTNWIAVAIMSAQNQQSKHRCQSFMSTT